VPRSLEEKALAFSRVLVAYGGAITVLAVAVAAVASALHGTLPLAGLLGAIAAMIGHLKA
jgi:hypothetical protein